ncbi:protein phosphatase 2C domain-containing protein [Paenibacillus sp. N4]|uniref:PP2C family protein-serine/threonine phosphatase n=1 Tax=Paenibacillus vietnamensis TaxID=2590547 RepID=UPI001CD104A0|nr:protein phosphatase 2C domain-containing protein [Paenibacillus vietnamensis]MCA0756184.1 protein phosphatase 2C domain-containing protein [Paenibacillus vietnamensis]
MVILWGVIAVCALVAVLVTAVGAGRADSTQGAGQRAGGDWPYVLTGAAQHIGEREEQQDAYGFSAMDDPESAACCGALAVLADGMGGFEMGREAGLLAVEAMIREYEGRHAKETVPAALERAIQAATGEVFRMAGRSGLEWKVGTTLVAAVVKGNELYYVSAGDSRIYLLREGELHRLTKDHVYANRLFERVQAGEITFEEAMSHPDRHLLTSYLGLPELEELEANKEPLLLQPGDWVLLCSDGLYEELSEPLLKEAVRLEPQLAAEFLVEHVISIGRKHQDNATVAILAYE